MENLHRLQCLLIKIFFKKMFMVLFTLFSIPSFDRFYANNNITEILTYFNISEIDQVEDII